MPIAGPNPHPRLAPEYFRSFEELDEWRRHSHRQYPGGGVLPYVSRRLKKSQGKLLVSHDFKGGYVEDPFAKSFSFSWWSYTSLFNYFAHHRISIPPPEWIAAAHRQGVPVLGTIIFEGEFSNDDCLRMVVGHQHTVNITGPESFQPGYSVPVSPYYAELLADIAVERGFDGWIVNIEIELKGGASQARGLASWLGLFQNAVLRKVGSHGLVLWYDSVTAQGSLSWQERLSSRNLPFFLNSGGLYTNYNWYNHFPKWQIDYFKLVDPKHMSRPHNRPKSLQDIYAGVDLWGRGSHGGGGFGFYKALEHAQPQTLNLSIALFAPGWTWESQDEDPEWTYSKWLESDRKLWVGPTEGTIEVPPTEFKTMEPFCTHGPFQPVNSFFKILPPPDPLDLAFYTSFSPGAGDGWFVEGRQVFRAPKGWTDIHKQTTIGDLVWPRPHVYDTLSSTKVQPDVVGTANLNFDDAWNGGSSLQVEFEFPSGVESSQGVYWIPIQSLSLTGRTQYEATVTYKVELPVSTGPPVRQTLEVAVRPLEYRGEETSAFKLVSSTTSNATTIGWRKTKVIFELDTPVDAGSITIPSAIGFILGVSTTTTKVPFELPTILLGQIAVYPHIPLKFTDYKTDLSWLSYRPSDGKPSDGMLSWDIVASLPQVAQPEEAPDREDPNLPWDLQPTYSSWFPTFLYFNVYALLVVSVIQGAATSLAGIGGRNDTVEPYAGTWLGTTGYDGTSTTFPIISQNLPKSRSSREPIQYAFQVEGVMDTGEVMRWSLTSAGEASTLVTRPPDGMPTTPPAILSKEELDSEFGEKIRQMWLSSLVRPFRRKWKGRPLNH